MAKTFTPRGKKILGSNFIAADEVYDRKTRKKEDVSMKTAGMEKLLMKAEKETGYSNKPRVKPAKKTAKIVHGQKKVK